MERRKIFTVIFAAAAGLLLLGSTCKLANKAPTVPTLIGPTTGSVWEPLTYSGIAEDPDGDSVAILVDWGDGTPPNWWAFLPSGRTVLFMHSFTAAGTFAVRAKARDRKLLESDWSDSFAVSVESSLTRGR